MDKDLKMTSLFDRYMDHENCRDSAVCNNVLKEQKTKQKVQYYVIIILPRFGDIWKMSLKENTKS
jgi:hypothetical protein